MSPSSLGCRRRKHLRVSEQTDLFLLGVYIGGVRNYCRDGFAKGKLVEPLVLRGHPGTPLISFIHE